MPIPMAAARLNRRVTNPILSWLAARRPPLAVVFHRGRRSGQDYRTPVLAFLAGGEIVIALTYGPEVDWLRNVLAAGGCRLVYGGRVMTLVQPRLVTLAAPPASVPAPVRLALRLLRVDHYLLLTPDRTVPVTAEVTRAPR
jgi:deazaflavin-dependent oxidoreductase (nitroreductase family)